MKIWIFSIISKFFVKMQFWKCLISYATFKTPCRSVQNCAGLCRSILVGAGLCRSVPVSKATLKTPCRYVPVCAGLCRSVQVCAGLCRFVPDLLSRSLPVCYGLSRSVPVGARLRPKERRAMTTRTTVCKRHFITYNKQTQRVN